MEQKQYLDLMRINALYKNNTLKIQGILKLFHNLVKK